VTSERRRHRGAARSPLREVDAWLAPFRHYWNARVDALERHLDRMAESRRRGKSR
jgi:hypothetical protein